MPLRQAELDGMRAAINLTLSEPITVQTTGGSTSDGLGGTVEVWTDVTQPGGVLQNGLLKGWFVPTKDNEKEVADPNRPQQLWNLFLPVGTIIGAYDRVVAASGTYYVLGFNTAESNATRLVVHLHQAAT